VRELPVREKPAASFIDKILHLVRHCGVEELADIVVAG